MYACTRFESQSTIGCTFQTPYRSDHSIFCAFARVGDCPRLIRGIAGSKRLQLEPVALDQPLSGLVGLREQNERVELDDRDVEAELADHVHENRGLPLPRARQA